MRVGLSLLTLVPGISGGSETYARELTRALHRIGTHEYVALVPPLAPDAGDGLPTIVAREYSRSTTTAGRLRAMGSATLRPAKLRSFLDGVDVVHYPLTVPLPRPTGPHVITLLDVQHLDLPGLFPRGERLFRKLAYDRASRGATEVIVISEFVRDRVVERLGLDPAHVHRRLARGRPRALHPGARRPTRAAAAVPRAPVAAQEPRTAARGIPRDPLAGGRSSVSCSRGSVTTRARCRTGSRHAPSRERSSSSCTDGRPASSSRACTRDSAFRPSRQWRAAAPSPPPPPVPCRRCAETPRCCSTRSTPRRSQPASTRRSPARQELSERGLRRAALFTWDETARAHDRIYAMFS